MRDKLILFWKNLNKFNKILSLLASLEIFWILFASSISLAEPICYWSFLVVYFLEGGSIRGNGNWIFTDWWTKYEWVSLNKRIWINRFWAWFFSNVSFWHCIWLSCLFCIWTNWEGVCFVFVFCLISFSWVSFSLRPSHQMYDYK